MVAFARGGRDRPYLLHVPAAAGAAPAPLLVELHGRGIDAVRFDEMTGFRALADEAGFVLAMPSAVEGLWNDGRDPRAGPDAPDDVSYLVSVIEDVRTRTPVDEGRVFVVGMSNGATMAARLACERAERLAGFAQVAGTVAAAVAGASRPSRAVPVIQIHGTADPYAPYAAGAGRGRRARLVMPRAFAPCLGIEDWARFLVAANHAAAEPELREAATGVTVRTWHGESPSADVAFYRVDQGGHTWPGSRVPLPRFLFGRTCRSLDATQAIWEFLSHRASEPPAPPVP